MARRAQPKTTATPPTDTAPVVADEAVGVVGEPTAEPEAAADTEWPDALEQSPQTEPTPVLCVTTRAKGDSLRRAGRRFGPVGIEIPINELSADQIAALRADPRLNAKTVAREA